MSQNPSELYYAKTHEWVRCEEDGTVTVGITEHAQDASEVVNSDAFNDGWFFKMRPDDLGELEALMSADDYAAFCDEED